MYRQCVLALLFALLAQGTAAEVNIATYPLPRGEHPHDVAPDPAGTAVWYTAQRVGALGRLDPATGKSSLIPLGHGSAPHGVIVGPDGAPWITDSGLNAIVRVDPKTLEVKSYPLPEGTGYANLNTAAFDGSGVLWFTGQAGIYGRLEPKIGAMKVFNAPRGRGPYGITATPEGDIYYASLAGSYVGRIDTGSGKVTVLEPPTPNQGARRVWSDSRGRIWVSEWNAGQLSRYEPDSGSWRSWPLPGNRPRAYAVYVDGEDKVWVSDFGSNAVHRFDPANERFDTFVSPRASANVRQLLGRPGEVWAPESGSDHLVVFRTPD
jgi:virginiamycin B lyase